MTEQETPRKNVSECCGADVVDTFVVPKGQKPGTFVCKECKKYCYVVDASSMFDINPENVLSILEQIGKYKMLNQYSLADSLLERLVDYGCEMAEKKEKDIQRLIDRKTTNVISIYPKLADAKDATRHGMYSVAADLLNAVRAYRWASELDEPMISDAQHNKLYDKIIDLDTELEKIENKLKERK
jgi:hypothetical protein